MPRLIALALLAPALAWSHPLAADATQSADTGLEPWVAALLAVACASYAIGAFRRWRASGRRRRVVADALAFFGGAAATLAALADPLEGWSQHAFVAHMIQHEILMLVAAPLYVAGRPLATWAWALPARARAHLHPLRGSRSLAAIWGAITSAWGATLLQIGVLWVWHAPRLFDAAVSDPWVHAAQHASFLAVALCFWWAVLRSSRPAPAARAVAACFVTMIATGALGALLTLGAQPWYAAYADASSPFGLSPLEDQQLGGLVMWIPAGLVYVGAALAHAHRWVARRGVGAQAQLPSRTAPQSSSSLPGSTGFTT